VRDVTPTDTPGERGGVLLRLGAGDAVDAGLGFVPAAVARRLTTLSSLTPVLGTRPPVAGIALADGTVVTVLRIGPGSPEKTGSRASIAPGASGASSASGAPSPTPSRPVYQPGEDWLVPGSDRAVLCHLGGFDVALTGATVVATGVFDAAPEGDGVVWRNASVPLLDVRALYAQAEAAIWAAASTARVPASQRESRSASQRPSQPASRRLSVTAPEEEEEERGRQAILPAAPGDEGGGSA
jgi:hypothetical protein